MVRISLSIAKKSLSLPRIFEAKLAAHAATATIATGADFDRMKVHLEEEEEVWDGPRH